MSTRPQRLQAAIGPLVSLLVLAVSAVLLFSRSMQRALDHDEHQFVASAALWARESLLPYRDFPHFHMPYLVFVYGLADRLSDQLLLVARSACVGAAWLTLALLHGTTLAAAPRQRPLARHALACGAVLLLIFNPLFAYTSGVAWNHDIAGLLALGAFLLLGRVGAAPLAVLGAGLFLGLATGVRLSFAPLVAPCLLFLARTGSPGRRARPAAHFLGGFFLALLPMGWLLLLAPDRAVFDNIGYPALNTAYRVASGFTHTMGLGGKLDFMLTEVFAQPGNLGLAALFVFGCLSGPMTHDSGEGRLRQLALWWLPFLVLASLAPTPSWYQYFYAPVPFVVLGGVLGMALTHPGGARFAAGWLILGATLFGSAWQSLPDHPTISNLLHPGEWTPRAVHATGREVAVRSRHGRVLTLAPIYPLEGGATIDPAFASGPFSWRTAPYLRADARVRLGMVGPDELEDHLREAPPDAVLTGTERTGEEPLQLWARARAFDEQTLPAGLVLQVAPARP